jgi:ATP-binding cassette subfamily B (MDR/TAP) protein 1
MNGRFSANALAFFEGSRIVRDGLSSGGAGTVYAIVFLILDAAFVIGQAGPFIQSFANAADAGRRILSLIDHPDIPIDVYSERGISADAKTFEPGKEIKFSDVSFAYPARPLETVLDVISLNIPAGSSVGIVGPSGSGKSTIAALLLRLYDPSRGSISIGSHAIPDYNLSTLRKQIALVDQDPAVFSGTLYSNIKDGLKGVTISEDETRERCMQAAIAADAWKFIESLPDGLDTRLGEPAGTKLSGGQKQRLCLARALVGDPPVLVLDEATSALDTISEASILTTLSKTRSSGNRTTVMIAHRLAAVKDADNIIVMDKGRIVEQGTHESLMTDMSGAYRKLIEAQKFGSEETCESPMLEVEEGVVKESLELDTRLIENLSPDFNVSSKQSPLGTIAIIRRCLALSRARLFFTLLALVGSLITGGLIIAESIIFGHLIQLLNGSVASSSVNFFCLMFFVAAFAAFVGYTTSGSCFGMVSEHLIFRTRDISLRTILRQDMDWFLQPGRSTAALISVISMDSGHLSGLSGVIIGTIVSALVSVVGGAILAHIIAWKIAIVLFATAPIVILAGFFRLRVISKLEEKNQLAYTEAATLATEACSNIRTIAALGTERETSRKFHLAVDKYRKQTFRDTALGNLLLALALAITYVGYTRSRLPLLMMSRYFVYALAYWWGAKQVRSGKYTTQQFFTVLPAILFSAQAAGQIFSLAPDIGRARGAASRVFALHDQKPTIDTDDGTNTPPCTEVKDQFSAGSIAFKNVGLTYPSRPGAPVFTNLNLKIRAGETVALVGRSGAGKSSVISLIERFYDPTSGAVLLNGVDIKSVPVSQHRAGISFVSQDPDLFAGSVAFNVGLGARPGHIATREEVIEACKAVGIHEFVDGLPDGYET